MFSNINLPETSSNSDTVQNTLPSSWIFRKVLCNIHDVIYRVQSNLGSKKYPNIRPVARIFHGGGGGGAYLENPDQIINV